LKKSSPHLPSVFVNAVDNCISQALNNNTGLEVTIRSEILSEIRCSRAYFVNCANAKRCGFATRGLVYANRGGYRPYKHIYKRICHHLVRDLHDVSVIECLNRGRHTLFNTGDALPILVCVGGACVPRRSQSSSALDETVRESLGGAREADRFVWRLPVASSSKDIKRLWAL